MTKLPIVSGKEVVKALSKIGYYIRDQKGSHIHLRHPTKQPLTVPMHSELDRGTLKEILRAAELSVDEFIDLL
ncbi:MAG: type II toxin-antitoxin system HicA family toxin [Candidatus Thermoplasmatota archaeon]